MAWWKSTVAVALAAGLLLVHQDARSEDSLTVAVGARGVGETFVADFGQNAGIFKRIPAPLSPQQLGELIQMPERRQ